MEQIGLFLQNKETKLKSRNEREELIEYFFQNLKKSWGEGQNIKKTNNKINPRFINYKTAHLKLPDLHFLKATCDQEAARGKEWAKVFWGSLKIRG